MILLHLPSLSISHACGAELSALSRENQERSCLTKPNCAVRNPSSPRPHPLQELKSSIQAVFACSCKGPELSTLGDGHAVHPAQRRGRGGAVQQGQGVGSQGSRVGVFC